jgi:hypothetical protein
MLDLLKKALLLKKSRLRPMKRFSVELQLRVFLRLRRGQLRPHLSKRSIRA